MERNGVSTGRTLATVASGGFLVESHQLLWRRGAAELFRGGILSIGSDQMNTCYTVSAPRRQTLVFSILAEACAYFWEITTDGAPREPAAEDETQSLNRRH
jgi:hypothetical protein